MALVMYKPNSSVLSIVDRATLNLLLQNGSIDTLIANNSTEQAVAAANFYYDSLENLIGYVNIAALANSTTVIDFSAAKGTLALASASAGEAVVRDTIEGISGIKCTFSNAASATYIADYTLTTPIYLSYFSTLQIPIRFSSNQIANAIGADATPFQVWIQTNTGKQVRLISTFSAYRSNKWRTFSYPNDTTAVSYGGGASAVSDLNGETVVKIRIVQATVTASAGTNVWIGPIYQGAFKPAQIVITMDGCYISQYTLIRKLLKQYDIRASLAITTGVVGTDAANFMSVSQINDMYGDGHECINHTFAAGKTNGYANATDWPLASDISNDELNQWNYFNTNGWTRGIYYGVWGYGYGFANTVTAARQAVVLSGITGGGVKAMRKSVPFYNSMTPIDGSALDPLVVDGAMQVTSTDTSTNMIALLDRMEQYGELGIFTLHRAVLDSATPGALEIRIGQLDTFFKSVKDRIQRGTMINPLFSESCKGLGY